MISWVNPPNIQKINNTKLREALLEKSRRGNTSKGIL